MRRSLKRNDVQDTHDRYPNAEVDHLLELMRAHLGMGVLTTNLE
jgi:hypothetical protein